MLSAETAVVSHLCLCPPIPVPRLDRLSAAGRGVSPSQEDVTSPAGESLSSRLLGTCPCSLISPPLVKTGSRGSGSTTWKLVEPPSLKRVYVRRTKASLHPTHAVIRH